VRSGSPLVASGSFGPFAVSEGAGSACASAIGWKVATGFSVAEASCVSAFE
jgi:hypothetical protein